jgi:predicted dehydrogenase
MLADPSIDAVYVPLPSGVRNSYLREAIESGKHVYTEKPMGGTVEEIAELTALALAHNVQWVRR